LCSVDNKQTNLPNPYIPAAGGKMTPTPVFARNFVESKGMRQLFFVTL